MNKQEIPKKPESLKLKWTILGWQTHNTRKGMICKASKCENKVKLTSSERKTEGEQWVKAVKTTFWRVLRQKRGMTILWLKIGAIKSHGSII